MKKTLKVIKAIVLMTILSLVFVACQKDDTDYTTKSVKVKVQTEGIIVRNLEKNWNPETWVFNYNQNSYDLKLTGTHRTYTYTKTIAQLQQGFILEVDPDTYVITYTTEHSGPNGWLSEELDIKIEQTTPILTNSTITLNATHEDYLIVLDIPTATEASWLNPLDTYESFFLGGNLQKAFGQEDSYFYTYNNIEGDFIIKYFLMGGVETQYGTIPNALKNKIYHIKALMNGTFSITIADFSYENIYW